MELFGVSGSEFLVLVVLVILVSGTKGAAQTMALLKKGLSSFKAWNARLRQESNLGAVAADLNIRPESLDLRQYDPRRMVREAVREEMDAWMKQTSPLAEDLVPEAANPAKAGAKAAAGFKPPAAAGQRPVAMGAAATAGRPPVAAGPAPLAPATSSTTTDLAVTEGANGVPDAARTMEGTS
ncbi:MAG: hypothetical protein LBD51_05790 [Bifidobacteriaceae bacterium]|nr:hypothetical protein [Bifidobacteriaceae bacterium]